MKKTFLFPNFLFITPLASSLVLFCVYQIYQHGALDGLYLAALAWSMYVICVPAAHGRVLFGMPAFFMLKKKVFPEVYVWTGAVALNIVTVLFDPKLYQVTIPTHLLYRILTIQKYWPILIIALVGTWYRLMCGHKRYYANERYHTIIRYLILLLGLFVFYWLVKNDFIVMVNAAATG